MPTCTEQEAYKFVVAEDYNDASPEVRQWCQGMARAYYVATSEEMRCEARLARWIWAWREDAMAEECARIVALLRTAERADAGDHYHAILDSFANEIEADHG